MNHHVIEPMLRPLSRWAEHSQRQACRNAMVACTALAASRQEREEARLFVEDVLNARSSADVRPRAPRDAAEPGDLSHVAVGNDRAGAQSTA
jgi:hypothetical protein